MKRMLEKVESDRLDTNVSVAAISGFEGAVEGIRAVENRSIPGKIMVYPACKSLGLIRLEELAQKLPDVAACLNDGLWTIEAEKKLLDRHSERKMTTSCHAEQRASLEGERPRVTCHRQIARTHDLRRADPARSG